LFSFIILFYNYRLITRLSTSTVKPSYLSRYYLGYNFHFRLW